MYMTRTTTWRLLESFKNPPLNMAEDYSTDGVPVFPVKCDLSDEELEYTSTDGLQDQPMQRSWNFLNLLKNENSPGGAKSTWNHMQNSSSLEKKITGNFIIQDNDEAACKETNSTLSSGSETETFTNHINEEDLNPWLSFHEEIKREMDSDSEIKSENDNMDSDQVEDSNNKSYDQGSWLESDEETREEMDGIKSLSENIESSDEKSADPPSDRANSVLLPDGLCLQDGMEEGFPVKSIWSTKYLAQGVVFGPYSNTTQSSVTTASTESMWAYFIKHSSVQEQCNVEYCRSGGIFYIRTMNAIQPHTQLVQVANYMVNQPDISTHPHICPLCGKGFRLSWNLKTHLVLHSEERPHKCHQCGKSFAHPSALRVHEMTHNDDKPNKCPVCDKGFVKSNAYQRHLLTHTGEKPHECQICGKRFVTKERLQTHMNTHTGAKPHVCSVCSRPFAAYSNLKAHMTIHTGERRYVCPVCQKTFSIASGLRKHVLTHAEDKAFKCTQCDKTYARSDGLKNHMLRHTGERPHKCPQCDKRFALAGSLRTHMSYHNSDRIFTCRYCDKIYARDSSLKKHIKTHFQDSVHKCAVCNLGFTQANNLNTHMLKHTPGGSKLIPTDTSVEPTSVSDGSKLTSQESHVENPEKVLTNTSPELNFLPADDTALD